MFQDLAGDSSSYRVRVVVLQGMRTILHNHQAHVFMKQVLPLLGRMLDDVNEYVRCAMLNLLDFVKGQKTIKVCDVKAVKKGGRDMKGGLM